MESSKKSKHWNENQLAWKNIKHQEKGWLRIEARSTIGPTGWIETTYNGNGNMEISARVPAEWKDEAEEV